MKILIVATNATTLDLAEQIRAGQHQRIDYLELSKRFDAPYIDYNTVPENRLIRRFEEKLRLDIRQALQVAKAVRKGRYDVVFSMSERVGIPLGLLLGRQVRHVVQLAHPLSPQKLSMIKKLGIYRRWAVMIAPTEAEARGLRQTLKVGDTCARVLHYPVDVDFYRPMNIPLAEDEPEHFESLGSSYRDYPTVLRAMRNLPYVIAYIRAGSSWVHVAAGYERETIPNNIRPKPFVQPMALRECYARSRFIVVPIRRTTQWSAGCTTISQALAMGRAVIATRNPGLGDYLLDGEAGRLVELGNVDAMAAAISDLWDHPEQTEAMGRRGREWVAQNFALDPWLDQISALLTDR
jgi:glycosyltransferase involved in cell wall biosynthesis